MQRPLTPLRYRPDPPATCQGIRINLTLVGLHLASVAWQVLLVECKDGLHGDVVSGRGNVAVEKQPRAFVRAAMCCCARNWLGATGKGNTIRTGHVARDPSIWCLSYRSSDVGDDVAAIADGEFPEASR